MTPPCRAAPPRACPSSDESPPPSAAAWREGPPRFDHTLTTTHDKEGVAKVVVLHHLVHEHGALHRLAQTHLVRQHGVATVHPVPQHPVDALDLIAAQHVVVLVHRALHQLPVRRDRRAPVGRVHLRRNVPISTHHSTSTCPQVVVVQIDGGAVLEVVEALPRQVLVLQTLPLHAEFLDELAVLAQLRRRQQRVDVGVVRHVDLLHRLLRDDAHVQNAIHLRELGVEEHIGAVRAQIEEQSRLVLQKTLEVKTEAGRYENLRLHARSLQSEEIRLGFPGAVEVGEIAPLHEVHLHALVLGYALGEKEEGTRCVEVQPAIVVDATAVLNVSCVHLLQRGQPTSDGHRLAIQEKIHVQRHVDIVSHGYAIP